MTPCPTSYSHRFNFNRCLNVTFCLQHCQNGSRERLNPSQIWQGVQYVMGWPRESCAEAWCGWRVIWSACPVEGVSTRQPSGQHGHESSILQWQSSNSSSSGCLFVNLPDHLPMLACLHTEAPAYLVLRRCLPATPSWIRDVHLKTMKAILLCPPRAFFFGTQHLYSKESPSHAR